MTNKPRSIPKDYQTIDRLAEVYDQDTAHIVHSAFMEEYNRRHPFTAREDVGDYFNKRSEVFSRYVSLSWKVKP